MTEEDSIFYPDDCIMKDFPGPGGRSYCANSDLFSHILGKPRDLPEEVWKEQAEYFKHLLDEETQ